MIASIRTMTTEALMTAAADASLSGDLDRLYAIDAELIRREAAEDRSR